MPFIDSRRLWREIKGGDHEAVQGLVNNLVQSGIGVNEVDDRGRGFTSLHYAVVNEQAEICNTLLKAGADLNVQDDNGHTPLHLAAGSGLTQIGKILIDNGADLTLTTPTGATVLDYALAASDDKLVHAIQERQAENLREHLDTNTAPAPARYATDDYGPWKPTAADTERLERSLAGVAEGEPVVYDQVPVRSRGMRL